MRVGVLLACVVAFLLGTLWPQWELSTVRRGRDCARPAPALRALRPHALELPRAAIVTLATQARVFFI